MPTVPSWPHISKEGLKKWQQDEVACFLLGIHVGVLHSQAPNPSIAHASLDAVEPRPAFHSLHCPKALSAVESSTNLCGSRNNRTTVPILARAFSTKVCVFSGAAVNAAVLVRVRA